MSATNEVLAAIRKIRAALENASAEDESGHRANLILLAKQLIDHFDRIFV